MDIINKKIVQNDDRRSDDFFSKKDSSKKDMMEERGGFFDFSVETLLVVVISLIAIFLIRSFVIQPFFVNGSSMQPNFHDGDYLIVDEISYRFDEPNRGDVIVFRYPNNPEEYFIKRIIGLPGESVEIKDSTITVFNEDNTDGLVLNEGNYLSEDIVTTGAIFVTLGDDEYYVLGDNRKASSDSRKWGSLEENLIIGRAWIRAWPFNDFRVFDSVNY